VNTSDDIRVGIVNEGPYEPTWFYDGKAYHYRVSTPEMIRAKKPLIRWVPLKIAYEHWAVELAKDGTLVRATQVKERDDESQLDNRLAGICPKRFYPQKDAEDNIIKDQSGRSLGAYEDDRDFKNWFLNKIHFRLKRMPEYEEELASS
jgi:hypothetical protein